MTGMMIYVGITLLVNFLMTRYILKRYQGDEGIIDKGAFTASLWTMVLSFVPILCSLITIILICIIVAVKWDDFERSEEEFTGITNKLFLIRKKK